MQEKQQRKRIVNVVIGILILSVIALVLYFYFHTPKSNFSGQFVGLNPGSEKQAQIKAEVAARMRAFGKELTPEQIAELEPKLTELIIREKVDGFPLRDDIIYLRNLILYSISNAYAAVMAKVTGRHSATPFNVYSNTNLVYGKVPSPGTSTSQIKYYGKEGAYQDCLLSCGKDANCLAFAWNPPTTPGGWNNDCYGWQTLGWTNPSNVPQQGFYSGIKQ